MEFAENSDQLSTIADSLSSVAAQIASLDVQLASATVSVQAANMTIVAMTTVASDRHDTMAETMAASQVCRYNSSLALAAVQDAQLTATTYTVSMTHNNHRYTVSMTTATTYTVSMIL